MKIAFLGDSLTEGWPGAAYLPLLARLRSGDELINHGRAGDTVTALLVRMRSGGLEPVDLAFVWVGANDAVMSAWDAAIAACDSETAKTILAVCAIPQADALKIVEAVIGRA